MVKGKVASAAANLAVGEGSRELLTDDAALAVRAAVLSQRSSRRPADMWRFHGDDDPSVQAQRCDLLRSRIAASRAALEAAIAPADQDVARLIDDAIRDGDDQRLVVLGIDPRYAWLRDIARALVAGGPFVSIETAGPYAFRHLDPDRGLRVRSGSLRADERTGIAIAAMLRTVTEGLAHVEFVSLVDDLYTPDGVPPLTPAQRDLFVVEISELFRRAGVIRPEDVPGEQHVLLRESALPREVDVLTDRLRDSRAGSVVQTAAGDTVFQPSDQLIEALALHSPNRVRQLRRSGVLLRRRGEPTCHAMDAASYLHPICPLLLHWVILDQRFAGEQDMAYALGRSIGVLRQPTHHNVFFDSTRLSAEVVTYGIARLLAAAIEDAARDLRRFDGWNRMDPQEYADRNYRSAVLPEDRDIIRFVVERLAQSGLTQVSAARLAADIGSGPNLYPSMLLAAHLADDGAVDLIEYSAANRCYLQGTITDHDAADVRAPWLRFEQLMVEQGGPRYAGAFDRACDRASVVAGSVFALPRDRYDIVTSYFVAESITTSRGEFHAAIRSLAGAIRIGGVLVVAHMVGSRGWPAGNATFPAVDLSITEIAQAYRDAGLEFTLHTAGDAAGADRPRDGYSGMCVVIASR